MPKSPLPPAKPGSIPFTRPAPRSLDPTLAKGGKAGLAGPQGYRPRGKSANQLIHAQKPRGR